MEPSLTGDLVTLAEILRKEQPGLLTESAVLDRLRQEGELRSGRTDLVSPYPMPGGPLHPVLTRCLKRTARHHSPDVCYVETGLHVDDFPVEPAQVAAAFASLPAHARVFAEEHGWLSISWNEPSTDADRAALEAVKAEEAEREEFEAWKRAKRETEPA